MGPRGQGSAIKCSCVCVGVRKRRHAKRLKKLWHVKLRRVSRRAASED